MKFFDRKIVLAAAFLVGAVPAMAKEPAPVCDAKGNIQLLERMAESAWARGNGEVRAVERVANGQYLLVSVEPNGGVSHYLTITCNSDRTATSGNFSLDGSVANALVWNDTSNGRRGRQVWSISGDTLVRESAIYDPSMNSWSAQGLEQPENLRRVSLEPIMADLTEAGLGKITSIDSAWGPLAWLAGGIWHSPGQLIRYVWIEPNKVLEETHLLTQDRRVFTLLANGAIKMSVVPSQLNTQHKAYDVVLKPDENGILVGNAKIEYTFDHDTVSTLRLGRRGDLLSFRHDFSGYATPWNTVRRLTQDQLAEASAFYKTAREPDQIRQNWGLLAQMVGDTWQHKSFGDRAMKSYRWLEPGIAMIETSAKVGNDAYFVARPSQVVVGFDPVSRMTTLGTAGTPDGGMVRPERNGVRGDVQWLGENHFREIFYQKKANGDWKKLLTNNFYRIRGADVHSQFGAVLGDETDKGLNLGGNFAEIVSGAIMGAATGYADIGGNSVGAIAGAVGGAAVGSAGGNDAQYAYLEQRTAEETANAQASERELQRTIARAQEQSRASASADSQNASSPSAGDRLVQQEQARAEQLRQEREARAAEERKLADAEASAKRQREQQAPLDAEAARNRPVDWIEGVVLCEPRSNSKQWRCIGPLQTNVLELDVPNTFAQLALACGGDSGIREIGPTGGYRAYGCGFGIHPTASNYPGNRDAPKDLGVFVSDRRVFRCPTSKDAYCRNQ